MLYRALGYIVWRGATSYLKMRYPNYRRVGGGVALFAAALAAGYVLTREPDE
jgi:hypothetical protein